MRKVLTAEEMREVDRLTTEKYGIPPLILMENAAQQAARAIAAKFDNTVADKTVLILCGKGNNGGDGAALGRVLWTLGADVEVCLFGKVEETKGDARTNFEILRKISEQETFELTQADLAFEEIEGIDEWLDYDAANFHAGDPDILVDALFGTGLTRPLEDVYEQAAAYIQAFFEDEEPQTLVVSLDVPSGLNADEYEPIGVNPCAHLTVTFTAPKLANVFPPASNFGGELVVADIGSPCELVANAASQLYVAEEKDAHHWICRTRVRHDSYKKTRGTALVVAGSKNYSGAAVSAANSCFAAGAGMVTIAVPNSIQTIVAAKVLDEIITRGFSETKSGAFDKKAARDVLDLSEKMHVVALGCGLTSDDAATKNFIREIVENRKTPIVLDADGLNALAPFKIKGSDELPLVLTPHIGEFQKLAGAKKIENRIEAARDFAAKHNVILLLKGERSLVAAPDGRVVINPTGNAGISRAGAGDSLTGIVAAFLAQVFGREEPNTENTFETVVAALYIASLAGDIAAEKLSYRLMSASDISRNLAAAIDSIIK